MSVSRFLTPTFLIPVRTLKFNAIGTPLTCSFSFSRWRDGPAFRRMAEVSNGVDTIALHLDIIPTGKVIGCHYFCRGREPSLSKSVAVIEALARGHLELDEAEVLLRAQRNGLFGPLFGILNEQCLEFTEKVEKC